MSNNQLVPELLTIDVLFSGKTTYTVPIYQRNYAWRAEQIEQLISDVQDAVVSNETGYFLGNLIVTTRRDENDFEVIDGQQRLTTLYLLLTFLEKDGDGPFVAHREKLHYQSRHKASEALRRVTSDFSSLLEKEDGGIHEAFNVIGQFFKQHKLERNRFANFLRSKVSVVRASLPPKTDLNRYFEIMNTRGQQLKQVDIVKARLMSRLPEEERACFAWIWDACADMDSYVQMSLTPKNTKLRDRIFGDDWSWLKIKNFQQLLRESRGSPSSDLISRSALSLDDALKKYVQPVASEPVENDGNERFRSTIEFPAFLLHVLRVVNHHHNEEGFEDEGQLDDKRLIKQFDEATKANGKIKAEQEQWVRNFVFQLLKLRNLFDAFILKRQYATSNDNDGDWSLQRLKKRKSKDSSLSPDYINTVRDNDLLLLQSMLRITYTSPRTMHWMTKLLILLLESEPATISNKHQHLTEFLRSYARSKVEPFFAQEQPTGFDISRIVFTYLDYLLWEKNSRPSFEFTFRNSIEHFYPQHPDHEQSGARISPGDIHLLGNLALVSISANSKFSNSFPKAKAENFKDTIETQSLKLQRMAKITREQGWEDKQMQDHHDEMVSLLRSDVIPSSFSARASSLK